MEQKLAGLIERYRRSPEFLFADVTNPNQPGLTGDTLLHAAVIRGVSEDVDTLVELGAQVNIQGDLGNTPIHHAASRGNMEIVNKLLRYGADVRVKNEFGQTPIDLAILMKHDAVVTRLKKETRKN
jgi:ankyrin repeat protein